MFPFEWYLILIVPLVILYGLVIWRRTFNLGKQFQLQGDNVKSYLFWLIHDERERCYIWGNFISVGIQTLIWVEGSKLHDPYGYSFIFILLIAIFTNWLVAILSLIFCPYSLEIAQITLAHRAVRPVMLSIILSGLLSPALSLALLGILAPSSSSSLISSPLYYVYGFSIFWTLYGPSIMLSIVPFVLAVSGLISTR
jgi:hypothetical protein